MTERIQQTQQDVGEHTAHVPHADYFHHRSLLNIGPGALHKKSVPRREPSTSRLPISPIEGQQRPRIGMPNPFSDKSVYDHETRKIYKIGDVLPESFKGGAHMRVMPQGSARTMDYRPERKNVELDEQRQIVRIYFG
jgi:hypothetical protein